MAQCPKCGALKLSEQPCARCGYGASACLAVAGTAIPVNLPEGDSTPPMMPQLEGSTLGFDDIDAAFNMRDWLQKACEAQGAKITGGGFGGGVADISIELEGHDYWLTIKAMKR